jgi:hypothetical protein
LLASYGRPALDDVFESMDPPVALNLASIGQVHRAKLMRAMIITMAPLFAHDLQQTIVQHAEVQNSAGTMGPWTSGNPDRGHGACGQHHTSFSKLSPVLDAPINLRVLVWSGLDLVIIRCGSRSGHIDKKNVERKNIMRMDGYARFLL